MAWLLSELAGEDDVTVSFAEEGVDRAWGNGVLESEIGETVSVVRFLLY